MCGPHMHLFRTLAGLGWVLMNDQCHCDLVTPLWVAISNIKILEKYSGGFEHASCMCFQPGFPFFKEENYQEQVFLLNNPVEKRQALASNFLLLLYCVCNKSRSLSITQRFSTECFMKLARQLVLMIQISPKITSNLIFEMAPTSIVHRYSL